MIHNKKIGIGICYDIEFPEYCRIMALKGAEIIVAPTANWDVLTNKILVPARAAENSIVLAYVNRIGEEGDITFPGLSSVVNQVGEFLVLMQAEPELAVVSIPSIKGIPYLQDRRTDLYPPSLFSKISQNL